MNKQRINGTLIVALGILIALQCATFFTGPGAKVDAQTYVHGRYEFIDLSAPSDEPGEHFAIFDSERGTLNEWRGKREGLVYTYDVVEPREITRRSTSIR